LHQKKQFVCLRLAYCQWTENATRE